MTLFPTLAFSILLLENDHLDSTEVGLLVVFSHFNRETGKGPLSLQSETATNFIILGYNIWEKGHILAKCC